jgi:hypothetical protein
MGMRTARLDLKNGQKIRTQEWKRNGRANCTMKFVPRLMEEAISTEFII